VWQRRETIIDSRRATLLGRRPSLVLSGTDNLLGSTLQSSHMRTVKVMIIGNSGVGKTSLRGQVCTITWLFIRISR
jgi:polynucleotide 5'-kinase involved in rRNA processing